MTETFSLTLEQAHAYDDLFVPALFAQWVPTLLDCAGVGSGQRVLDVACGTGVAARTALDAVGPTGRVSGVDLNQAMIEVAREREPRVEWQVGDVAALPYDDASFDAVLCQSALFFFPDPQSAAHEMARVAAPGGVVALQTYAALTDQPGYGPFVDLVVQHTGPEARRLLGTYWSWGDLDELRGLLAGAGLEVTETRSELGTVAFPTVAALVQTEIQATPLAGQISPDAYSAIVEDAERDLAAFVDPSGAVTVPIRARFVAGRKP